MSTGTKVSCNSCGAGKKLYWMKSWRDYEIKFVVKGDVANTRIEGLFEEKTDIKSTLYVEDIKKGCPKCGGELTEEL